ncbi:MAG: SurA N-terminal domain-containing protein, partial [Kiritimatiellae bacterium]|nr:SurA N-terminal domain-containing protein [Kiritimatiellia bacterium]
MLISKFNKLIRSKVLWSILAITIAFFFVGASVMSRSGCAGPNEERAAEGTIFGEEVSGNEFYLARYFELGMRPMADNSEEAIAALRDRTWRRVAALRMAARMGISVTDDDIRTVITQDPTFASNGVFDQRRYLAFLQAQLRIDPSTFEDYLRQDLTIRRLMSALRSATWSAPYEMAPRLAKLTDQVSIEYALLPGERNTDSVEVGDEDVASYFESYRDAFRIDEQLKVRYVSFPVGDMLDAVEVTGADIDDYYN